jgi:hypothetical protein
VVNWGKDNATDLHFNLTEAIPVINGNGSELTGKELWSKEEISFTD